MDVVLSNFKDFVGQKSILEVIKYSFIFYRSLKNSSRYVSYSRSDLQPVLRGQSYLDYHKALCGWYSRFKKTQSKKSLD